MNNTKLFKEKIMVLCLCHRCANDFRDSGSLLVKRGWQEHKEPCDFCQVGKGLNFGVFQLKKAGDKIGIKHTRSLSNCI